MPFHADGDLQHERERGQRRRHGRRGPPGPRPSGFDTYWAPQIFGHDALTALAIVGREVPRIEVGTSVVPTFPRHPMMLAQQALDRELG